MKKKMSDIANTILFTKNFKKVESNLKLIKRQKNRDWFQK